ncbi:hypothetical protein ONS96_008311 [Cadophora gregata f. sp. sojae]|nr:hypothetical protein ONS96_008311 [Cadophora gregata f. sp. sojae]
MIDDIGVSARVRGGGAVVHMPLQDSGIEMGSSVGIALGSRVKVVGQKAGIQMPVSGGGRIVIGVLLAVGGSTGVGLNFDEVVGGEDVFRLSIGRAVGIGCLVKACVFVVITGIADET